MFSPEEGVTFGAVRFNHVVGNPTGRPPWQADEDRALDEALASDPGRVPDGAFTNTTNNPPLYYALQVVPLKLADGGDFLDRLLAMRLLSVVLAGLTAAFVFLFLRELLPATPWAWPAGALVVAVQPLFGFVSGGVNNDAGMFAAGAAILWLVARAFRRGLDGPTAIGIGAALGLGLLMKATLAGLVPGLLVALAVLLARGTGERARTLRLAALAAAIAAVPVIAYVVLNQTVWDRPLWSGVPGSDAATGGRPAQVREFLSYVWQFYLPRLPFMVELQVGPAAVQRVVQGPDRPLRLARHDVPRVGVHRRGERVRRRSRARRARALARPRGRQPAPRRAADVRRASSRASCSSSAGPATAAGSQTGSSSSRRATCCRSSRSTRR